MNTRWITLGAVSGFIAVAMGAFGAHALKERLSEQMLAVYETGARYQMFHALALIAVGLWAREAASTAAQFAGWAFAVGTVLFSGSLYALALSDVRALGAITPLGGLSFLAGWAAFAYGAFQSGAARG